ncbi:MAG: hypothetical protein WCJ31_06845 [Planctomycetia bacterium]
MTLITALEVARYRKLADDIDAALGRGDEMGMEMLRAMLPEITEAIEGINEALRETDSLLYEGLRDEAIGLHDEEFPSVALRLHLQDKPQWPMAALFFETEGITPPPTLDFGTLSSLNMAFSELQELRKPIDRLRRMALERAPLADRIVQLRKIQSNDSTKPVWADQIAAFEEVRILEVADAVRRAIQDKNAEHVASLHKELTRTWGVPIPRRLIEDTKGGEAWASLRRQIKVLESLSVEAERTHRRINDPGHEPDDDIESLRSVVRHWEQVEAACREWLFALPQCPAVSNACLPEGFGPRLEELRRKMDPALKFVGQCDVSDVLDARHVGALQELEYLVDHLPEKAGESQWLSKIEQALDSFRQTSQQTMSTQSSEFLITKTSRVLDEVRGRASRRTRGRTIQAVLASVLIGLFVIALVWLNQRQQGYLSEIQWAQSLIPDAHQGNYVARPPRLESLIAAYPNDPAVREIAEEFGKEAAAELKRRADFAELLVSHKAALDKAGQAIQARESPPENKLHEWPSEIFEAKAIYKKARRVGGFQWNRGAQDDDKPKQSLSGSTLPLDARKQCDEEESRLAELASRQMGLDRTLTNGAIEEFQRQLSSLVTAIPSPDDDDAAGTARELRIQLSSLLALAKKEQSAEHQQLPRVPVTIRDQAGAIDRRLEKVID